MKNRKIYILFVIITHMVNQSPSNKQISSLEKVLVNWATPIEGLVWWPAYKLGVAAKPKYQKFFDQHGVLKGFWKSKIKDYQRLLDHASEDGNIPDSVLKLYNDTPCGHSMKLTYKTLRL